MPVLWTDDRIHPTVVVRGTCQQICDSFLDKLTNFVVLGKRGIGWIDPDGLGHGKSGRGPSYEVLGVSTAGVG